MTVQRQSEFSRAARFRADVVGLCLGASAVCGRHLVLSAPFGQKSSLVQLGFLLALAATAGLIAAIVGFRDLRAKRFASSRGARFGLRSGLVAALVGGGVIAAIARSRALNAPSAIDETVLKARMWAVMLVSLATILPAVVSGFLSGALGGKLVSRILPDREATDLDDHSPGWTSWASLGIVLMASLVMASPLTFVGRAPKVDPLPPPTAEVLPPPSPPPFRYHKPGSFDFVQPGQFTVAERKLIPTATANGPMLFSADSRLLAYCPANSTPATVMVWDLDAFEVIASFSLPDPPRYLAWSPDLSRIFYVSGENQRRMGVLTLQTQSVADLPQPKGGDIPLGPMAWWLSDIVVLFPADESPLAIDLQTLQLGPLDDCPSFKSADDPTKQRVRQAPRLEFPKRDAWQLMLDVFVQSIVPPPRREPSLPWNVGGFPTLAFKAKNGAIMQWLPQVAVQPGHLVLPAPDGSKFIQHSGSQTEVIYFGTRESVASVVSIKMPMAVETKKDDTELAALLKQHDLCAIAYAPMTNPLNGRTVGPDRQHVRAILRIHSWKGESAEFWTAEQFADLREGDVVADLHTWEGGRLVPAARVADAKWWAPFATPPRVDRDTIPTRVAAEDLDKGIELDLAYHTYAFELLRAARNTHPPKPRASATNSAPAVSRPAPELPPRVPDTPAPIKPIGKTEADVVDFIREHHRKASQGDVRGMMTDYQDYVDFLDKGLIAKSAIETEESAHRKTWTKSSETISGRIVVSRVGSWWTAAYSLEFRNENDVGDWYQGMVDLSLSIDESVGALRIKQQKATVRDVRRGKPSPPPQPVAKKQQAAPPKLDINVPKPCYLIMTFLDALPDIRTRDAISFVGGVSFHRTFISVDGQGNILQSCRLIYATTGGLARDGKTAQFRVDSWKWDPSCANDPQLMARVERVATAMLTSQLRFRVVADGLVEGDTGYKLQLEK